MESVYFINLIFIVVINVFFFFSGVCLNSVVIISFWRSVQLRKKLCYFMIMVLSCCDLLAVVFNNPLTALGAVSWLTDELNISLKWLYFYGKFTSVLFKLSLFALLVMNFDRYLATSYPLFHRALVTKGRLLTLMAILTIIELTLTVLSTNDTFISFQVHVLVVFILVTPPMLFINYKLFSVVRRNRRNNEILSERKKAFSLTKISSCLIATVCYVVLSIPVIVYIAIEMNSRDTTLNFGDATIAGLWLETTASMNSSFNCLIFYWKNKVLRIEGWKVINSIKLWRRVQS